MIAMVFMSSASAESPSKGKVNTRFSFDITLDGKDAGRIVYGAFWG